MEDIPTKYTDSSFLRTFESVEIILEFQEMLAFDEQAFFLLLQKMQNGLSIQ